MLYRSQVTSTIHVVILAGWPAAVWAGAVAPTPALQPLPTMFDTSEQCMACHDGLRDRAGKDISIVADWRPSMMANASRDPYWQAAVRREVASHPAHGAAIEAECSRCHMPMAAFTAMAAGGFGEVFVHLATGGVGPGLAAAPAPAAQASLAALAADGVSCSVCHQLAAEGLGDRSTLSGRFTVDRGAPGGQRRIFGPFAVDAGRTRIMSSATTFSPTEAAHVRESALCASCHTLFTHTLGPSGEVVGELPEQVPYLEWQHSTFAGSTSCQDCHFESVAGEAAISSVWGLPRAGVARHAIVGGNFVVPALLAALGPELGVVAPPAALAAETRRTRASLAQAAARLGLVARREADRLLVEVAVTNLTGHKLPSAYPSRRAWLHLVVRDASGRALFESGALAADGSIVGNDNDADPRRFEPHYDVIDASGQVQIYEPILGDSAAEVTTGLLAAARYLKDNRLLPEGFDKATAGPEIAVSGNALADPDFVGGGDVARYAVALAGAAGALTVSAELWYQPIGFRWAENLAGAPGVEPARFVQAFRKAAADSAARLAAVEAVVP